MPKVNPKKQLNEVPKNQEVQIDLSKEYNVSEGMISDILKARDHALTLWVENALQAGLVITDNILSTKALEFAYLCKEEKFKGSNGWAQYRKLYLHNRVKVFDNYNEYGTEPVEIDIKKCIKYVARTWENVTSTTIENCWLKADILPKYNSENEIHINDYDPDAQVYHTHIKELGEVQELIDMLDFESPFTADEYIQYDSAEITTEILSNDEILKVVLPDNQEKEAEELLNPLPLVTHSEAIETYDKVILYLEQQEDSYDKKKEELKFIKKLRKEALRQRFISAKQINIDSFIESK
ncbi:unnamed protein product [Rhizophagus irregularis]|nr:unnamed protein product [Rhizophagus irregularis]